MPRPHEVAGVWSSGRDRRCGGLVLRCLLVGAAAVTAVLAGGSPAVAATTPQITGAPTNPTTATPLTWTFDGGGGSTSCQLDSGATTISPLADCTSPATYTVSTAGSYTFTVYGDTASAVVPGTTPSASSTVAVAPPTPVITAEPTSPGRDTTPTWQFSLPTGASGSCEVDRGGQPVIPAATCTSPYTADLTTAGDGTYTLTVTATAGGVTSAPAVSDPYQLDTTPPPAPTVTAPPSPSANRSPSFTVTDAESGVSYACTVTGPVTVSAQCGPTTTLDLSGAPDGTYTLSVTATDAAGNTSPAGTAGYTLQASGPVAPTITAPPSPGNTRSPVFAVTDTQSGLTFTCAATDSAGNPVPVTGCGTTTTTLDLTGAPDGRVTLTVTATDAAGNFASSTAGWTLDTTPPPAPTVTAPASPGNSRTPTFTVTDTEAGVSFTCSATDSTGAPVPVTSCGSATTLDLSGTPDGTVTLQVAAIDAAGNQSPATTATYVLVTVAPAAPTVIAPTSPGNTKTPTFQVSDPDPRVVSLTCRLLSPHGRTVFSGGCPSPATFDTTGYADGTYTLTVTAADAAGNTAATTVTWTRDTTPPPAPVITAPSSPGNTRAPAFAVSEGDPTATLTCAAAGPGGTVGVTACGATTTLDLSDSPDGDVTLTVTATDPAGNATSATATWTLDTTAPAAPTVTLLGTSPSNNRNPQWQLASSSDATLICTLTGPGGTTLYDGWCGPIFSAPTLPASGGDFTLTVVAWDAADNHSPAVSTDYLLDTVPPGAPQASLVTSTGYVTSTGLVVSNDTTPGLLVTPEPDTTFTCAVDPLGGTPVPLGTCPATLNFTGYDASGGVSQELDVVVTATDEAGNTASTTLRYELMTIPPAVPLITAAPSGRTPITTQTFSWSTGIDESYTCRLTTTSGVTVAGPVGCVPGWTITLGEGGYVFTVVATDAAGNVSAPAVARFRIDPKAPPPPVITAPPSPGNDTRPRWLIHAPDGTRSLTCRLTEGHRVVFGPASCPGSGRFDLSGDPDGVFVLTVTADLPQGMSRATAAYQLDTQPPPAPQLVTRPHRVGHRVAWSFLLPPDTQGWCRLLADGRAVRSGGCTDLASYQLPGRSRGGSYVFEVVAVDAAGNVSPPLTADYRVGRPTGGGPPPAGPPPAPSVRAPAPGSVHAVWRISDPATASFRCTLRRGQMVVVQTVPCGERFGFDFAGSPPGLYTLGVRAVSAHGVSAEVSSAYAWSPGGGGHRPRRGPLLQHLLNLPRAAHPHPGAPTPRRSPAAKSSPSASILPASIRPFAEGVQRVIDTIGRAGGGAGFPLLLVVVVLVFLLVQNRIDHRDPKLALAPVGADDLVEFAAPPARGFPAAPNREGVP